MEQSPFSVTIKTALVLDGLAAGLDGGAARVLVEPSHVHLPLRVERLADTPGGAVLVLGQYHESRVGGIRARIPNPEVNLLRTPAGDWIVSGVRTPWGDEPPSRASLQRLEAWVFNLLSAGLLPSRPHGDPAAPRKSPAITVSAHP